MLQVESYPQPSPPAPHLTAGLTLYSLADDLVSLLDLREDMAENKEGTEAVDAAIAEYMQSLIPPKVDAVAHVLLTLDSQTELAAAEVQRLAARRRRIASAAERLRQYCCDVLAKLPAPKKGSRKLEGSNSTLILKGNGGLQKLDVYEESLVPDEFKLATVALPLNLWLTLRETISEADRPKATVAVDEKAVRKALDAPCWVCEGSGLSVEPDAFRMSAGADGSTCESFACACPSCGGSGKAGVPGARLLERGHHLEIK